MWRGSGRAFDMEMDRMNLWRSGNQVAARGTRGKSCFENLPSLGLHGVSRDPTMVTRSGFREVEHT